MGIKERRERQRREVKQGILDAVCEILRDEGWAGVTIRKIADAIEYSPPMIYEHYVNKEAILRELQEEWYRKLLTIYSELVKDGDPAEQLEKCALAYFEFAARHPEFYKIIMGTGVPILIDAGAMPEVKEMRECAKSNIAKIVAKGKEVDLEDAVDSVRSIFHGAVAFVMLGQIKGGRERAERVAISGLRNLIAGWRTP